MITRLIFLGLMIAMACMFPPQSFAQDYAQVSIFNHFTDWTVTLGKSPDEKQRIINERIQLRARNREAWDHRRDHEQHIQSQQDKENKDHQAGMSDLDNQKKAVEEGR